MTDEHIKLYIEEFMAERGVKEGDNLIESDLMEFARLFLGVVDVNGKVFLGVDGWLMWIHGCLLQRFCNLTKEHPWKEVKDVPELMAAHNAIDEFERFVTLYLGFDYNKGAWIDRNDEGERFDNFGSNGLNGSNGLEINETNKKILKSMKEINVTDVMLGDWVLYEHKNDKWETESTHYLKVENITSRDICMRNGDYARVQCVGYGCIKPIPLTAEILEKNDFRRRQSVWGDFYTYTYTIKQNDKVLEYEQHFNLWPDPYEGDGFHWFPEMSAVSALRVVYVHELQQLLRLCKIEKEIIL